MQWFSEVTVSYNICLTAYLTFLHIIVLRMFSFELIIRSLVTYEGINEMTDIIVIGNPGSVDAGNFNSPSGPSFANQHGAAQLANNYWSSAPDPVTADKDVADADQNQEIVVIGKRIKEEMRWPFVNSAAVPGGFRKAPCIQIVRNSEVASILKNMKFQVTSKDYGTGRAGANNVGKGGSAIPVEINVDALKNYAALTGGLQYLVNHEVAHSLKYMQEFAQQKWLEYLAGAGAGMTPDQARASFADSAEFKLNEARANTIARALSGNSPWNFVPTYGFDDSCGPV